MLQDRKPGPADYASGVFVLADDSDGTLWAGTLGLEIWRLVAGRWTRYPNPPDPALEAGVIFPDRGGGLWLGTNEHGLRRIAKGRTERFTRAEGLSGNLVNDIFEDLEGSLWVATSAGLDRFRDIKVETLTGQEGLGGGDVGAVTASRDGGVWIAENRALIHLGPTGMSNYAASQGLPGSSPTSLFEDSRGRLWVGVDNGLAWWDHGRFFSLRMPDGGAVGIVRGIVEDRDGSVWVSTIQADHALLHILGERIVEIVPGKRIGGRQISAMAAHPEGGVWIGLTNSKLKLYRNGGFEPAVQLDIQDRKIYGLLSGHHGLWLITSRGLGLLRNGTLRTLDTRHGLPCDAIEDAVPGEDESLWVKTICGLVRIPAGELDAWSAHPERRVRALVLDAFDGAQAGLSPFAPRATKSLDGRLWFAIESGGLQVVDPKRMKDNAVPPPVRILRVVADRKTYEPLSELRLPPLTRDLRSTIQP